MKTSTGTRNLSAFLPISAGIPALFALTTAAEAQDAGGERLFQQRCGTCHSLQVGQNGIGPHLADVIGRTAGSIEGARYSDTMRASGIVWDRQSLDSFLAAPRQMVSDTTMTVSLSDPAQRAAIITYLETSEPARRQS